ncbi:MAG: TonB-dependent receptor plug domain-containing protein [Candidatus Acidiferrales bacterium]
MQIQEENSLRGAGEMLCRVVCALALVAGVWTIASAGARAQAAPQTNAQTPTADLHGKVVDEKGSPVARVEVKARWMWVSRENPPQPPPSGLIIDPAERSATIYTDAAGEFRIDGIESDKIAVVLSKPGYFRIENGAVELKPGVNEATFTLPHETELEEKVEVFSAPVQIDPTTTSHDSTLVQHEVLTTPVPSSQDLQQSLVTMPNVVMDTNGRVHIAGARQGQTEILLDGFEINDPANGAYTPQLNVDAVQTVLVETGGYGAQYAHANAGVLSLDTNAGDDKWRFGITNFIPSANFERGIHFGQWFPRWTFSGPIKKGRAWFSNASTIRHSYTVIQGLPSGQDVGTEWAGDDLLRAQVNITPRNILQANFLINRSSEPQFGLGPFSPMSTTTNLQTTRYFVSVRDLIWVGKTLIEIGIAGDTAHSTSTPQGTAPYMVTPSSSSGNYFQTLAQTPRRLQFIGNITSETFHFAGTHTVTAGWNAAAVELSQQATRSEIDYLRADGTLSEQATFSGPSALHISNTQLGGYVQELWRPVTPLVFVAGVRVDWDRLIEGEVLQPRLAMNWVPKGDGRMKFTVAWGEYYQPLNLSQFAQALDMMRTSVFFDSTGLVPLGSPVTSAFLIPKAGLIQPVSYNASAEWETKIRERTFVGASYLLRTGRSNLAWELQPSMNFLLMNDRKDQFKSVEGWVRHSFGDKAEIFVDYTRSSATSNQVLDPTLFSLLLSPQQGGPLLWDAPNRVITRGYAPLPIWQLLASYFFEYHSGFPYTAVNEQRQLVGAANSFRFPTYFSLNVGLEKQFRFRNHEWAIRVSSNNVTGHDNPDTVVDNVDAPTFGAFSGGHGRTFVARIRLVTAH